MDSLTIYTNNGNSPLQQPKFEAENEEEALSPGNPTPYSPEDKSTSNNPYSPIEPNDDIYHGNTNTMIVNLTPITTLTFENEGQSSPQFETNDITNNPKYEHKNEFNDASDIDNKPKKMTLLEFQKFDIKDLISNDNSLRDHFDIGKKICKYFDTKFNDTDTVCMVADTGKQPQMSYWCKGDWVKKYTNCNGKHILIFHACKHIPAKKPIVTHEQFEKYVKRIALQNRDKSCTYLCNLLDEKFGDGCHMARSTGKKPAYDIYCRFSDKYECAFKLPSGFGYVIAWRR